MSWRQLRLIAFSVGGTAFLLVGLLVQWASVEGAGTPLLAALTSLGALMVVIVVFDVAYYSWRGEGQACRHCGHLRPMKPFRVYGACPNCGKT